MRIISKFHDFYDNAMAYGIDKEVIYLRSTEELRDTDLIRSIAAYRESHALPSFNRELKGVKPLSPKVHMESRMLYFCGKLYPFLQITGKKYMELDDIWYCYSTDQAIKYINQHGGKGTFENDNKRTGWRMKPGHLKRDFDTFFSFAGTPGNVEFHRTLGTPVFMIDVIDSRPYRESIIIKNPRLQKYHFYRGIDPVQAFQEIHMFISGVLGIGTPELVEISNTDMRDKKGFDDKSFKTPKGVKKPRRKK